jgi:predicted amidohydrolase
MALEGATVVAVPSAFTAATGPAHWELLLRARAVENQVFVIGAGQVGALPPGMPACHGHSMIVDPWGSVLAERAHPTPGVVLADLDVGLQARVRSELPVLANRRPAAYRWPRDDTRGGTGSGP